LVTIRGLPGCNGDLLGRYRCQQTQILRLMFAPNAADRVCTMFLEVSQESVREVRRELAEMSIAGLLRFHSNISGASLAG
jgi:hypothetical protein